jgi:putative FmdB family regulatory protein
MPIYGYRCSSCGHEFEIQQKMSDEALKTCPKCEGKLTKILYPTGIVFKGSGFYTTDYKAAGKSSSGNGTDPAAGSSKKSESKGEPKTETKPESKPESKSDSSD